MADKELECLQKDFMRLQEICMRQEQRLFEISRERDSYLEKIHFYEKKEIGRRDDDLKLMQEFQTLESEISKKDEELFSLNCIKKKFDETRAALTKFEKEAFANKFAHQNHEEEVRALKKEIEQLNLDLNQSGIKKTNFKTAIKEQILFSDSIESTRLILHLVGTNFLFFLRPRRPADNSLINEDVGMFDLCNSCKD